MAYISFRGVKVAPTNLRWSICAFVASLISLIIAVIADRITHNPSLAYYTFLSAQILLPLGIVIAVPAVVIPVTILLAPFVLAVVSLDHDYKVWRTWWFWTLTVVCEILGGFALVWFGMNYGKREP
ncbi:MAG: hypothetical protein KA788_05815 [Lacunisphaera sp.]|nr:hypothetical protein [Lacunisphaera sp.]